MPFSQLSTLMIGTEKKYLKFPVTLLSFSFLMAFYLNYLDFFPLNGTRYDPTFPWHLKGSKL